MRLELVSHFSELALNVPHRLIDLVMLGLYMSLLGITLFRYRSQLGGSQERQVGRLLVLRLIALLLPLIFVWKVPTEGFAWAGLLPVDAEIAIPLLAPLPILIAALYMGMAPAALVGLSSGLTYALSMQLSWTQALEGAILGLALGYLLGQRRPGFIAALARQPAVSTPLTMLLLWPAPFYAHFLDVSLWAHVGTPASYLSLLGPIALVGLSWGVVMQLATLFSPVRPATPRAASSPSRRRSSTLAGKILARLVPANLIAAIVAVALTNVITLNVAYQRTIDHMESAALEASSLVHGLIPRAEHAGATLVHDGHFASLEEEYWHSAAVTFSLSETPFQELILLDRDARLVATVPAPEIAAPILSDLEIAALETAFSSGETTRSKVFRLQSHAPLMSIIFPVGEGNSQPPKGAILGRIGLAGVPEMANAWNTLGGWPAVERAFLMDEHGQVILQAGKQPQSVQRAIPTAPSRRFPTRTGQAFQETDQNGSTSLVYWLALGEPNWHLVLERSRSSILWEAGRAALAPLLILAGLFTLLTTLTVITVRYQLRGLGRLAVVVSGLANGTSPQGVDLSSETQRSDEVGLLCQAIQQLSLAMGSGVEELARLAEVSQSISARSNIGQTLETVLRATRRGLKARSAGVHLITPEGLVRSAAIDGEISLPADAELYLESLAQHCWRTAAQIILPDIISRLSRAPRELLLRADLRALVMLPIIRDGRTIGTLWAEWSRPQEFSRTELSFLTALSNLAGIMIDNNRVYRAVENERSRLEAILHSTRDGIIVADAEGRVQMVNPTVEELLGLSIRACVGQPLPKIIGDSSLYRMLADIARGREPSSIEIEHAGRRLAVGATMIGYPGRLGSQGWVLVTRDVSDMRRLDAMQTDFVSTITHNMKSPLTYVRGYVTLLPQMGPLSDQQREYLDRIVNGIDDITQLIDDASDLGQVANRVGLSMTRCNVVHIVAEVAEAQRGYAEAKGLKFTVHSPAHIPETVGDPRWLKHAMRNLVDNAIKYTYPPGSITVCVEEQAASTVISVADTGVGIAPADCRRIFEQFYRVRRKETVQVHGTGLGLSLVKKVAEQHGGRVWVQSELNKGSVFYFAIPKERRLADILSEDYPFAGRSTEIEENSPPSVSETSFASAPPRRHSSAGRVSDSPMVRF